MPEVFLDSDLGQLEALVTESPADLTPRTTQKRSKGFLRHAVEEKYHFCPGNAYKAFSKVTDPGAQRYTKEKADTPNARKEEEN